jgi:TonB-linked SusC/RagA family outer membrane protein
MARHALFPATLAGVLALLAGLLLPASAAAQTGAISGTVTDSTGRTLPGVNVIVEDTQLGASTGVEGGYTITGVSPGTYAVRASFVGYGDARQSGVEVTAGDTTTADLVLGAQTAALDEVVVVGYGQQTIESTTGAVEQVSGDEIAAVPVASVGNALSGRLPGVSTIQTTGQPGQSDPELYLRGISTFNNTDPLVVIDGVPSNLRTLMQLNPNTIESISVLKDASSTAVYGVRGANGVVVAETRRGRAGEMQVSAEFSTRGQVPTNMMKFTSSYEFAQARNRAVRSDEEWLGESPANLLDENVVEAFRTGSQPLIYPNNDPWEQIAGNVATQYQGNVNVSGGTTNARYFASLGYLNKEGLFDFEYGGPLESHDFGYQRYNINANVDLTPFEGTSLKATGRARVSEQREPRAGGAGPTFWGDLMLRAVPYGSPGIVDGRFTQTATRYYPFNVKQSVIGQTYGQGYRDLTQNRFNVTLTFEQSLDALTEGLQMTVKGNYKGGFNESASYNPRGFPTYVPIYKTDAPVNAVPGDSSIVFQQRGSFAQIDEWSGGYSSQRSIYGEARLEYDRTFGNHTVGGLALYTQEKDYYPSGVAYANIPSGYVGGAGRVTYNYDQRYFLEFNAGYNGSENFASDQRFGFFPAISGAWTISNEPFMEDVSFVDLLKLKASYGKVGNDRLGGSRFLYIGDQYATGAGNLTGYNFGVGIPQYREGTQIQSLGNENVTWETAVKQNYGLQARFFDGQLRLGLDYFRERRNDILMTRNTIPAYLSSVVSLPAVNIGKVNNRGLEASLGWKSNADGFAPFVSGNFSYAKNEVVEMDEVPPNEPYQKLTGEPLGSYVGFVTDGFYTEDMVENYEKKVENGELPENTLLGQPAPGDLFYKDLNDDGQIDLDDQSVIGNPRVPQITFGGRLGFNYAGFDVSTTWQGAAQVSRRLSGPFRKYRLDKGPILEWHANNSWTPERAADGDDNLLPRLTLANRDYNTNFNRNSTKWVRNASYLRLKSAQVGYSFTGGLLDQLGSRELRVYLAGYNLWTLTHPEFKGVDPEQNREGYGTDTTSNLYPQLKVFSAGVNIQF